MQSENVVVDLQSYRENIFSEVLLACDKTTDPICTVVDRICPKMSSTRKALLVREVEIYWLDEAQH